VDHGVPPLSVPLRNPGELAASDSCTYGDGGEIPGEGCGKISERSILSPSPQGWDDGRMSHLFEVGTVSGLNH
jgi:hypothetical protein